jgi:hypothetical protein
MKRKSLEKLPPYLSAQMTNPAASSHTATPIFRPAHLGEYRKT